MSMDRTARNLGTATFYIAIDAGSNIAVELRRFLNATRYAYVQSGEQHYKNFLLERGHKFKNEGDFYRVTHDIKESDIQRVAVSKIDRDIIEKEAKRYGLDYLLVKRPNDLESLAKRKFVDGEQLNPQEEKILKAFTSRENGKTIMDEKNPSMPLLNKAEYMFTIAEKDLDRWDLVCRQMELRSHKRSFYDRMKDASQRAKVYNQSVKNRVHEREKKREDRS